LSLQDMVREALWKATGGNSTRMSGGHFLEMQAYGLRRLPLVMGTQDSLPDLLGQGAKIVCFGRDGRTERSGCKTALRRLFSQEGEFVHRMLSRADAATSSVAARHVATARPPSGHLGREQGRYSSLPTVAACHGQGQRTRWNTSRHLPGCLIGFLARCFASQAEAVGAFGRRWAAVTISGPPSPRENTARLPCCCGFTPGRWSGGVGPSWVIGMT